MFPCASANPHFLSFEMDEIKEAGSGMLKLEKNEKTAYYNLSIKKQVWAEEGFWPYSER